MANVKHSASDVIKAIKGSDGIKTIIANRLGVHRNTINNYLDRYITAKEAYYEEVDQVGDIAESVIIEEIKAKNIDVAKWYARMKLKHRGYIERQEYQHEGDITINVKYGKNGANGQSS